MNRTNLLTGSALCAFLCIATPIYAGSIAITYDLSGTGTVVGATDTTLTLDAQSSGSILTSNAAQNAIWNPVNYSDQSILDFTTNLLHGNFTITLQNGDTLTGTVDEDQTIPDESPTGTGAFTQTLTFMGGTGEFAGATGSVSGNGFLGTTDFTVSGSGTLDLVGTPEPATAGLLFAGLGAGLVFVRKRASVQVGAKSLLVALIAFSLGLSAKADPLAYIETSNPATGAPGFGTLDLKTGAFQSIGSGLTDASAGLVPGAGGSLLTLAENGNLDSINPVTGVEATVGPTGLGDCSAYPASPCGLSSANAFGSLDGKIYATDYGGNLYTVNASTGHATLIGSTGLPKITIIPFTMNADGSLNVFDESLFDNGGKLYANADVLTIDPNTGLIVSVIVPDSIYQIDPVTGHAAFVASTTTSLNSFLNVYGTEYSFDGGMPPTQVLTLNIANGNTTDVASADPNAGLIFGAALVTPEPSVLQLVGVGMALVLCSLRRWRASSIWK